MHSLAIDPSTAAGWALKLDLPEDLDPDDRRAVLSFGTWKLGDDDLPGRYFLTLFKQITELRKVNGIEEDDLQIVVEDTALNAIGNAKTKHLAESWIGIVELYCAVKGLPAPIKVSVGSWRKAFIGRSKAPKEVGADQFDDDKASLARRKWIKAETVLECRRRNFKVTDDNQADALGILFWFLHDGHHVQEQRRADKLAKTKAKRAQLKLFPRKAA